MLDSFLEAWVNTGHKVLGRKLHPFCLEDVITLYATQNPIVKLFDDSEGTDIVKRISNTHIELFVEICSRRPQYNFDKNRFFWRFGNMFRNRERALVDLAAYLSDYLALPDTWPMGTPDTSNPGCPWPLQLGNLIAKHANVPWSCNNCSTETKECVCVWRMPLGKALWLSAAIAESNGTARIADEELGEFYEEMLAYKAAQSNE